MKKLIALLILVLAPLTSFGAAYPISQGGTGTTTFNSGGVLYSNGGTKPLRAVATSTNSLLFSNGTGALSWVATSSLGIVQDLSNYFTLSAWYATTTDGLDEGSTNLYFTNTRAQSALSGLYEVPLTFGDGLTRTVNDIDCDTASGSVFGCLTSTDWNTFNGKQAAGNYITTLTGDVTASGPGSVAATVVDDSHAHTGTTLSGIDISSDTNLSGDTEIVLTGDALSIASTIARDSELHDAVTLAGTPDYITLAGQVITRGLIDLASDITGILPSANVSTSSLNLNHTALGNLGFTSSGHTGTAFRLFGTDSSGAAAEYATSSLGLGTVNTGATRTVAYYPTTAASVSPLPLSAITINATNDGVGIFGTAASNAFEVTGAASVSTTFSAGQTITSNNGGFRTATGTAASPVYAGTSANANTGMFIPATDQLGFSIDGTNEMTISSTGLVVNDTVTTPLIYGSSASGGDLELISSSHATKGSITIGQDAAENIGIGTPADPDVGIYVSKSWSSNNSGARGIQFFPVLETTATGNSTIAIGGQFRPAAAVAQGTGFGSLLQYGAAQVQNTSSWNITTLNGNTIRVDELSGYSGAVTTLNVLNMTAGLKGGTGTIGTVNVINIPSGHTVYNATNLRGLKSALAASTTAPTSAYNLYIDGTAPNYFAGKVGLGESAPAAELELSSSATTTIQSLSTGAGARGSRIILEDYDGAGCTEIYTLNGVITGRIVTCL